MNQVTISRLRSMRLPTMADKLQEMLSTPKLQGLGWPDAVDMLVDSEHDARGNKRLASMLRTAHLKYPQACLEDLSYGDARGITKDMARPFRDGSYIKDTHNVLIAGPTGTGKSYLACALANHACRNGIKTRYARVESFLNELEAARSLGVLQKALERLYKVKLLILDDLGADPMSKERGGSDEQGAPKAVRGGCGGVLHDPFDHHYKPGSGLQMGRSDRGADHG